MHEALSPISHIKKFELVKGDACVTVPKYMDDNPHAIVACSIFDFDIYKPTKIAIESVLPRLTRGSFLVFDELNCPHFPGETQALLESIGLNKLHIIANLNQPYKSYIVYEG